MTLHLLMHFIVAPFLVVAASSSLVVRVIKCGWVRAGKDRLAVFHVTAIIGGAFPLLSDLRSVPETIDVVLVVLTIGLLVYGFRLPHAEQ